MPTYEYTCKACDQHLEVVQSFKDNALTECPACGGPLRKVFGNIGIAFKGSGFYRTDSQVSSVKPAAKSETKSSEAGGGEAHAAEVRPAKPGNSATSSGGSSTGSGSGSTGSGSGASSKSAAAAS